MVKQYFAKPEVFIKVCRHVNAPEIKTDKFIQFRAEGCSSELYDVLIKKLCCDCDCEGKVCIHAIQIQKVTEEEMEKNSFFYLNGLKF